MASTSEVGHPINVANFQDLIEAVIGYGATYAPSKTSLQLIALNALQADAEAKLLAVTTKKAAFNMKVNERVIAFSDLRPLATRILNALQVTEASDETIKDAKTINRKIQGKRATDNQAPLAPDAPVPITISSSQQSYDQLIQHLTALVELLKLEPTYTPAETDLQIVSLEAYIVELRSENTSVATAHTNVNNAIIARDETLYKKETGLFDIAADIKKYVKSVYGAASPQYNQIKGIKFTKIPK